jgi:hypothetical protein
LDILAAFISGLSEHNASFDLSFLHKKVFNKLDTLSLSLKARLVVLTRLTILRGLKVHSYI